MEKAQAEIDILGEQDRTAALFGACKWTNEKVDLGVLGTPAPTARPVFHPG